MNAATKPEKTSLDIITDRMYGHVHVAPEPPDVILLHNLHARWNRREAAEILGVHWAAFRERGLLRRAGRVAASARRPRKSSGR